MSRRSEQVANQLVRLSAEVLVGVTSRPDVLLTVTRGQVAPDLRQATVWVAGWDQLTESEQTKYRHEIQVRVQERSTSKFTPRVRVVEDDSSDHAQHIARLLSDSSSDTATKN